MHYASYLFEHNTIKGSRLPNLDFQLCDIILQFTIYGKGHVLIYKPARSKTLMFWSCVALTVSNNLVAVCNIPSALSLDPES